MTEKLPIWVCETYYLEVEAVLQARGWDDIDLHLVPQLCMSPMIREQMTERLHQIESEGKNNLVLMGSCYQGINQNLANLVPDCGLSLDQCFYKIANRTLVDYLMTQGAYVLTPGWLNGWQQKLEPWGFEQATAREFFHEFAQKLVLLDTRTNSLSTEQLQELGVYLDLPTMIIPVGLDYLDLYLAQIVSEWKREKIQHQAEAAKADYNRQMADNSMALDLLTHLTRAMSEDEAIREIIDLFRMLFSPDEVLYCSVMNGEVDDSFECNLDDEEESWKLGEWVLAQDKDYAWTSSGQGFFLRLTHQNQTVGILQVNNFRLPEYKQQYLNLSLSIARLCGLAIANTRLYQKLKEAESSSRHEKEISETLRQVMTELTSQLDLEDMLGRILKSLIRVIPYSIAAIFMLDETQQLRFKAGMQFTDEGDIVPYSLLTQTLELDLTQLFNLPRVLVDVEKYPQAKLFFGDNPIHGWLWVPLLQQNKVIGYLSIGSRHLQAYGEEEAALAQSFADEASIAIEKARLFSEIRTLAGTDSLTGLYNRRQFFEIADTEIKRSNRYQRPLSVIMLDVDYFKKVNDTYGHSVGDTVLMEIASCCKRNIRVTDYAGRYGGEEFVLLLPETTLANAVRLAERLRLSVAELRISAEMGTVQVTVSLGVAELEAGSETVDELLRQSDKALYEAKKNGRNCVFTFKDDLSF